MEHKPIRRSEYILPLSKDHHVTLLFCWKIRQGLKHNADPERIKNYVQHFWQQHMNEHFREEEEILFAPLMDEKVQKALMEHNTIKEQIHTLKAITGLKAAGQLMQLANLVDAHVRYEERELFTHLEEALTKEQLVHIGKELQKVPTRPDDYPDEFWRQPNAS